MILLCNITKAPVTKGHKASVRLQGTSLRRQAGFVNTVASQLTQEVNEKSVRTRLALLRKCEAGTSTLTHLQSLVLQAQELGAFGVKHEAQRLVNTVRKAIRMWEVPV